DKAQQSNDYADLFHGFLNLAFYRLFRPWLHSNWIFRLTSTGRRSAAYVHELHQFTNSIIAKRKEVLEEKLKTVDSLEASLKQISASKRLAFLDLLLVHHLKGGKKNDDGLSLVDVREEVDFFMAAGTDTTVTTIQIALLLIGLHQDKQE